MSLIKFSKLRRIFTVFGLAIASLSPGSAWAGGSDWGSISEMLPHSAGLFFNSSGTRSSAPACATISNRWVINTSTAQGQALAAALLTAYMAHKRIYVGGTGTCSLWNDTETVLHFKIED